MSGKVRLDISIAEYPHTQKILDGTIEIEGVEPNFIKVTPQIGAYRRMVRKHEFDVCEIAPTTYVIARAYGAPFVALPIFVSRGFHHSGLLVRPEAGITKPKDLEGHKVGVRAYSVTTGAWTRAIMTEEFGLDTSKVTWVVDDEEHVTQMPLPPNVIKAEGGRSLNEMMKSGELVAGFSGNAGVGRIGSPSGGWQSVETDWPDLFPNAAELEGEWYRRTQIYPMHGTIVVKDAVLEANPWVARSLSDAFTRAKEQWLSALHAGTSQAKTDAKFLKLAKIVGPDPLPYGMEHNLPSIEALELASFKQKLSPRRMEISELFVDPAKV